uniref:Ig-like domain-containing protein n=1 Tax=Chelydra serpentina TaxID=8475 RepID=A0A8C3RQQ8_CHESE
MGHCTGKELQRAVTSFLPSLSALPVVEVSLASSSPIDKETTLTCSAWDFYPGDVQLSWSKDDQLLTNSTRNDSLFHNSNGSYSYISDLVVSRHDWNEPAQFSCQVNHSTLKMPVVKNLTLTQSDKGKYVLCIMTFLGGTIYSLRSPVSNRKYGLFVLTSCINL